MSTEPLVICPQCEGVGAVPLTKRLGRTLALFNNGDELSAEDCWNKSREHNSIGITALNNRLNLLAVAGLLKCRKDGKTKKYSRTDASR